MKTTLTVISIVTLLTGCIVPTQYSKSISVTKDANGNIISTTETEGVTQPPNNGSGAPPIQFTYLRKWWGSNTNEPPRPTKGTQ